MSKVVEAPRRVSVNVIVRLRHSVRKASRRSPCFAFDCLAFLPNYCTTITNNMSTKHLSNTNKGLYNS